MLLTTYSNTNKVIDSKPIVTYTAEPTFDGEGADAVALYWTLTRASSGSFRYVGMTAAAADACAAAMREEYTRKYAAWQATATTFDGRKYADILPAYNYECLADISVDHAAGSAYEVSVTTNDTDIVIVTTEPTSIAEFESIFQEALMRDSTASVAVAVTSADYYSLTNIVSADFTTRGEFTLANLTADIYDEETETWTAATGIVRTDGNIRFAADDNCTFRLNYNNGAAYSKSFTTTSQESQSLVISSCTMTVTSPSWYFTYNSGIRFVGLATIAHNFPISCCKLQIWKGGGVAFEVPLDGTTSATDYTATCSQSGGQWKFDVALTGNRVSTLGLNFATDDLKVSLYPNYHVGPFDNPTFTPTKGNYLAVSNAAFDRTTSAVTFDLDTNLSTTASWLASNLVLKYALGSSLTTVSTKTLAIASVTWDATDEVYKVTAYATSPDYNGGIYLSANYNDEWVYAQDTTISGAMPEIGYYDNTFVFVPTTTGTLTLGAFYAMDGGESSVHKYQNCYELYKLNSDTLAYELVSTTYASNDASSVSLGSVTADANYKLKLRVLNPNIGRPSGSATVTVSQYFAGNFWPNAEDIVTASFAPIATVFGINAFAETTAAVRARTVTIPNLGVNATSGSAFAQNASATYALNITAPTITLAEADTLAYLGITYGTFTASDGYHNIGF